MRVGTRKGARKQLSGLTLPLLMGARGARIRVISESLGESPGGESDFFATEELSCWFEEGE